MGLTTTTGLEQASDSSTDQNDWLIDDDDDAVKTSADDHDLQAWNILIVDDDVDVHVVTKFALRDARYKGRPFHFLHAYSGKEGLNVLRTTHDVALVLLDVIMESDHAGLELARQIRGELDNQLVRIVLRTGQSGQTLEQNAIVDYDINDYRTKNDLTTQKLFTTVISSLRTYDSLKIAHQSVDALKLAQAKIKQLRAALEHHTVICTTDLDGKITHVNALFCAWIQHSQDESVGQDYRLSYAGFQQESDLQEMWQALARSHAWQGNLHCRAKDGSVVLLDVSIIPVLNPQGEPVQYLAVHSKITNTA